MHLTLVRDAGYPLLEMVEEKPDLEQAFLNVTSRAAAA
jgi:hypothetical protein